MAAGAWAPFAGGAATGGASAFASSVSLITEASSAPQSMMTSEADIHKRKKMIDVKVPWSSLFRTTPMAEKSDREQTPGL